MHRLISMKTWLHTIANSSQAFSQATKIGLKVPITSVMSNLCSRHCESSVRR